MKLRLFAFTPVPLIVLLALSGGCMVNSYLEETSSPPPLSVTAVDSSSTKPFTPASAATNQLGLELIRQLAAAQPGENHLLISPYSIQNALAMAYAGADGDTRAEMARVLHFPDDDKALAASFGSLRDALESSVKATNAQSEFYNRLREGGINEALKALEATGLKPTPEEFSVLTNEALQLQLSGSDPVLKPVEFHVANRLFGQAGYAFRDPFLNLLKDDYGAPFEPVDFKNDFEPARVKINDWVGEQTKQKIRDLIPSGGLNEDTRLVLVNALYFKSPWQDAFEKRGTENRKFRVRGTDEVRVSTMVNQTHNVYGCAKGSDFTVVTLPYRDPALQLVILLPDDPAGVNALASKLTPALLQACAQLKPPELPVVIYLPKLHFEPDTMPLGEMLRTLGLKTAFDKNGRANFQRIAVPIHPEIGYRISEVFHKTYLELDEEGTEAAAATGVAMAAAVGASAYQGPPPPPPIIVHVDHPFLFAIQHRESGACLFLGRVEDPR